MAKVKILKREQNGNGSIVKLKGGAFQFWYNDPKDGKRKAIRLKVTDKETGKLRNCKDKDEAEEARSAFMVQIRALDSITTTEKAQTEIAKTRKLITALTVKPSDIWQMFMDSPTRKDEISSGRLAVMKMVFDKFAVWCDQNDIESADGITPESVNRFFRESTDGLSSRSKREYRIDMKTIFRHTYRALGMAQSPANEIVAGTAVSTRREALTEEQIGLIFQGFDIGFKHKIEQKHMEHGKEAKYIYEVDYKPKHCEELRIAIMFALYCGCRCKDACLMRWSNADLANRVITYKPAKTAGTSGKTVTIPIVNGTFQSALWQAESWKGENAEGEDYISPNLAHWYLRNPTGVTETIGKVISYSIGEDITNEDTQGRKRKANRYGMHSFRHSFVSFCWNSGIRLETVAEIVGHTNPIITETYLHKDIEKQRAELSGVKLIGNNKKPAGNGGRNEMANELKQLVSSATDEELAKILAFVRSLRTNAPKRIAQE